MKLFYDLFPLIVFFGYYKYTSDLIAATGVLIIASAVQIAYLWIRHHRIEKIHLITFIFILILGGATIILRDDTFIKWKPTVVNWVLALAFLISQFVGEKSLLKRMLEQNISLPSHVWRNLNLAWVSFFFLGGALNLYVAFHYSKDVWVNFKVFGLLGLSIVFIILQGIYLARYLKDDENASENNTP
jgi:intracellular septation protein